MDILLSTQNQAVIASALLGLLGGLIRAGVGFLKVISMKKKISFYYTGLTLLISAIIGISVGAVFNFDFKLSVLAGYVGMDILEEIYKVCKKNKKI